MNDAGWKLEFASRFRRRADELKSLYCELYHHNLRAWDAFAAMLYKAWEDRPDALKELDRVREKTPNWYKKRELAGMQLDAKAFAGTLKNIQKKLDYLAECGVNYLHLAPLLAGKEERGGGYGVSDFRQVRPELGTMDDLAALAAKCHERGILVGLDFVLNHTADTHEWAQRAKAGEREYQNRYFFYDTWDIPNAYEQTMPQELPDLAPGNFSWCEEAQKAVLTTFYPDQWDLNYAHFAVFNEMTENLLFLCNQGADMIRLEAVPFLWKALGTNCRNLRQTHCIVRMLRLACDIVCPGAALLGDTEMDPHDAAAYFGTVEKPECHMLYNGHAMSALWNTLATHDVRLLHHQLEQTLALPRDHSFLHALRSRDGICWNLDFGYLAQFGQQEAAHKKYLNDYFTGKWLGSAARGETDSVNGRLCGTAASLCGLEVAEDKDDPEALSLALRKHLMLHALIFTLNGLPVLCGGDEIAQKNDHTYLDDPQKREDTRYLHQGDLDWKRAALRKRKTAVPGRVFSGIKALETLRRDNPVFDDGAEIRMMNAGSNHILCIGRSVRGEKLLALFNFSDDDQTAWLNDPTMYVDMLSGEFGSANAVSVPGGGFKWLLQK